MNSRNESTETLFRRFLDGELTDSEEQKVLHLIAEDAELREMLRFERSLLRSYNVSSEAGSFAVPEGFADSVMSEIENEAGDTEAGSGNQASKPAKIHRFRTGQIFAAAAIALISMGLGYTLALTSESEVVEISQDSTTQFISEQEQEIWMRFVYFDEEADMIEVAGDFSNWDPIELNPEMIGDRQVWTGLVPLSRGEHRYMFIKDGDEWITDPLADVQQDDGFGNKNAVIFL
ncbi:MAG: hypothetical protein JJU46_07890 [Balneolaceae bacterium]|nr:hypothetical protein [Balneolaceae bacterium]MCH8549614.1 hypothetical protein [Balneolaceae bacterium]